MKWLQHGEHGLNIALAKVEPRRFLQTFMPLLMPENSYPDELFADLMQHGSGGTKAILENEATATHSEKECC